MWRRSPFLLFIGHSAGRFLTPICNFLGAELPITTWVITLMKINKNNAILQRERIVVLIIFDAYLDCLKFFTCTYIFNMD